VFPLDDGSDQDSRIIWKCHMASQACERTWGGAAVCFGGEVSYADSYRVFVDGLSSRSGSSDLW
jgi:hypothetical protein